MKTKYITAAALVGVAALFIFQRREKMGLLFDTLKGKAVAAPAEEPAKKYTPIRLSEDEALKRDPVNGALNYERPVSLSDAIATRVARETEEFMNPPTSTMSEPERRKLIQVVQNFTQEELEIVLDTVPLEMCFDRIKKEIDQAKEFESMIKTVVGQMH